MNKIKTLRNKADRLLQELNRKNNDNCIICGNECTVGHHYITKGSCSALRYEMDNIIPLCNGCHLTFHSNRSAIITGQLFRIKGQKWFDNLEKKRHNLVKTNQGYYKQIIEDLTNKLNE